MLRVIKEFPSYSMNEEMEVFNSKGATISSGKEILQLTANGKHYLRSRVKMFQKVFPELKVTAKLKPYINDDSKLIPSTEPARYEALNALANNLVMNGHNEFVDGQGEVRQSLWAIPVTKDSNQIVLNGMSYNDLIQEALLVMYDKLSRLASDMNISEQYLQVAVRNHFLDMYKKREPLNNYASLDYTDDEGNEQSLLDTYVPELDEIDFGVSDDIIEKLKMIQSKLNKQDYEIIYYYYGYEMSMDEIAERVGLARQTVSGRIKRIVDKLHREFNRR